MFEKEVTVAILSPQESLLGFLHPNLVEITETNELYQVRSIEITHPLLDENNTDLSKYDNLLIPGNKVWRSENCDGVPCLYVMVGEKVYDFINNNVKIYAEEVAIELSQNQVFRSTAFAWVVNSAFLTTYCGDLFTPGTIDGPSTETDFSGALTPMAILRLIESSIAGEFNFRYIEESGKIARYIDWRVKIGSVHTTPIELGYNALNIVLKINEADTRIAAAPKGTPDDANVDAFHQAMAAFAAVEFKSTTTIPLYVTKDESGNPINGPLAAPPYNKPAGQNYVECQNQTELTASYQRIYKQPKVSYGTFPRIYTFDTSETNIYNLYWACVVNIKQYLQPEVTITCNVIDIDKLTGGAAEHYNVGDTVYVRLPGRTTPITARVMKTTKNPREPQNDTIEIGNYKINFMKDFYKSYYKSSGAITI